MPPLGRLCFVLPTDDADTDAASAAGEEIQVATKNANPSQPSPRRRRSSIRRRASDAARRALCCFCGRRCDRGPDTLQFHDTPGVGHAYSKKVGDCSPRIFSYAELFIGTNGFSEKEVLGSGGFGRVYRAVLPSDGTVVAVKCVARGGGARFEKTFAAELVAVAQLRHRNLVRLRGWCVHDGQLLLVYDYMPNRSLDRLLFAASPAAGGRPLLPWDRRQRVVSGLAAALFYLHEQLDTQIIHRDVKASNVMLDGEFNARLGDFGLARWLEHSAAAAGELEASMRSVSANNYQFRLTETSRIGGTIGYLSPESFQKRGGAATAKSDVFSFGVVVLEVATGRRAVDLAYPDDQIFMLDWVRRLADDGRILNAGDHRLPDGSYPLAEMKRLIHLGLLCTIHDPNSRPTMKWVMENLCATGAPAAQLPALPSFRSYPQYVTLSASSASATTTATLSKFVTANNSSIFVTADDGGGSGCGGGGGGSGSSRRSQPSIPNVDTPREIPYKEIAAITNNFSETQMVAELDFGTGYHGYLENRVHVLVKRLGMRTCPALRARFSDELHNLVRLRHRHLVQLRGWCTEQGEMLVVYDYSARSLLSHHLFHRRGSTEAALGWRHRLDIVRRLASAVVYLHEEWEEQVIHRNITSSAVFLDPDMNPRLGCFALAEFLSRNEHGGHHRPNAPSARGIFGYMSPEYVESGEATAAADVYSFGVVVLEVVTGRMAVDFRRPEVLLLKKIKDLEERRRPLEELADRRLDGRFDSGELTTLLQLGMACTRSDPNFRPTMKQVVGILDGNLELLKMLGHKSEGREEWERRNAASLSLVKRIQALGIH